MTVGKKPKVQIQGGDLWSSGTVNTSTSVKSNTTFGSWVEYGIFAAKSVSGMASGAAFSGSGLSSASVTKYSKLSFNNTDNSDCKTTSIGCYSTTRSLPDVAANFSTSDSSQVFSGGSLNDKQGIYRVTENNISIDASDIQKGQWVVINAPDATVTITGDIKYTSDTLTNINDIPQVIIIAKNIIINNSVTNVDSWLIAKNDDKTGSIKTCEEVGNVVSKCNNKLTVNGPVITDQLYLYRTAGSGAGGESGSSAETFNLRPDAYLWSYSQASKSSRVQTIYTTELPPRL